MVPINGMYHLKTQLSKCTKLGKPRHLAIYIRSTLAGVESDYYRSLAKSVMSLMSGISANNSMNSIKLRIYLRKHQGLWSLVTIYSVGIFFLRRLQFLNKTRKQLDHRPYSVLIKLNLDSSGRYWQLQNFLMQQLA